VEYAVDQEDLLPALREAIRMMRPEEVVVFLFPSYLCYGYQGDGEKIGVNQPLRFTVERLPIN
jgi:FKBP-type peptidyl-prolyl cis-trans isomerase